MAVASNFVPDGFEFQKARQLRPAIPGRCLRPMDTGYKQNLIAILKVNRLSFPELRCRFRCPVEHVKEAMI